MWFDLSSGVRSTSVLQRSRKDGSGPVQLSKFLGREKDSKSRRSVVSGKKIQMKVERTKEDKLAETNRMELLKFLNSSYD